MSTIYPLINILHAMNTANTGQLQPVRVTRLGCGEPSGIREPHDSVLRLETRETNPLAFTLPFAGLRPVRETTSQTAQPHTVGFFTVLAPPHLASIPVDSKLVLIRVPPANQPIVRPVGRIAVIQCFFHMGEASVISETSSPGMTRHQPLLTRRRIKPNLHGLIRTHPAKSPPKPFSLTSQHRIYHNTISAKKANQLYSGPHPPNNRTPNGQGKHSPIT